MKQLNSQGIYFTRNGSGSNQQGYNNNSYGYGDSLTVECRYKDNRKVTNQKRMELLVKLYQEGQKKGYLKIDGRNYDLGSLGMVFEQAYNSIYAVSMNSYNGGGYNQYGNNTNNNQYRDNQCPSNIIAQGSVMSYQNYR